MSGHHSVDQVFSFVWYLAWADLQQTVFEEEMGRRVDSDDPEALRVHQWRWFGLMSHWYASLNVVIEAWEALHFSDPVLDRLLAVADRRNLLRRYRNAVLHFQCPITSPKFVEFLRDGESHVPWVQALQQEFVRFLSDYLSHWSVTSEENAELRKMFEDSPIHWYPYQHHPSFESLQKTLAEARQILSQFPDDQSEERRD